MKRVSFIFFCVFFTLILKNAFAHDLSLNEHLFNPGDTITARFSWDAISQGETGLAYFTITLPNNLVLYVTPGGLVKNPVAYSTIDLSKKGFLEFLDFEYPNSAWFPQGLYQISAWVAKNDPSAALDQSKWLTDKFTDGFEVTSHYIPITYPDYDSKTRAIKVARTEGGLWIVFADYSTINGGRERKVYAMKVSKEGRTFIPPFYAGKTNGNYCFEPVSNAFSVLPSSEGGFYLFTGPRGSDGKYKLREQLFDKEGHLLLQKDIKSYRSSITRPHYLTAIKAGPADHAILLAEYDDILYLYINDSSGFHEIQVTAKDEFDYTRYKAFFDSDSNKVFLILAHYNHNTAEFMRYDTSGNREVLRDISGDFSNYSYINSKYVGWPEEVFRLSSGLMLLRPVGYHQPTYLLFLDENGQTLRKVQVNISPDIYGDSSYSATIIDNVVYMVWRSGSSDFMCASFDLDGNIIHAPTSIFHESNTGPHPIIVNLNDYPFMLLNHYDHSGNRRILGAFLGYDFPAIEQDLVLSAIHIKQSPAPYALLGSPTKIFATVFNRGEANSNATTLTFTYLGSDYQANIPVLQPGEGYQASFSVQEPPFLTRQPAFNAAVASNDWQTNNQVSGQVYFQPMTPVFINGAGEYHWNLFDSDTLNPIKSAWIFYDLKDIETVSGVKGDVKITARSDAGGQFETILPDGNYSFTIQKGGYPTTIFSFSTPPSTSSIGLEPPGDLQLTFRDANSDGQLHPVPQIVSVSLQHQEDPSLPDWEKYKYEGWGDQNGIYLEDLMPGAYSGSITAFGYYKKDFQVNIVGGSQINTKEVALTPVPRGSISGRIISSGNGVSGVSLKVYGTSIEGASENDGRFTIDDLPMDKSYVLEIRKDGYQGKDYSFEVTDNDTELGDIELRKIYSKSYDIPRCRYAAWVQDASWDISVGDSYELKTIYGVWQNEGKVHYKRLQDSDTMDIDQVELDITPMYWSYFRLDGHIIDAFFSWALDVVGEVSKIAKYVAEAFDAWDWGDSVGSILVTYDQLSDPMGTVRGGVVECGDPDTLDLPMPDSSTIKEVITVLRIDDLRIYDGDPIDANLVYSTHQEGWHQYYSDQFENGHITIPVHLSHNVNVNNMTLRVYLRVMDGKWSSGPLALVGTDKLYLEWKMANGQLKFNGLMPNPVDYPSFEN